MPLIVAPEGLPREPLNEAVTQEEYRAGFERFETCLADRGFALADVEVDREVIRFAIPEDAVVSGAESECYVKEFQSLDEAWQLGHEDDSVSADIARYCLESFGFNPRPTLREMSAQLEDSGVKLESCLEIWHQKDS